MTTINTEDVIDQPVPEPPAPRRGGGIALLVSVLGAIIILTIVGRGVATAVASGAPDRSSYTSAVDGVTAIDIDVSDAFLTARFADVDEARLDIEATGWGASTDWTFEVDGGVLRVGADDWSRWWPTFGMGRTEAELVLPRSLEGRIEADLSVSAGDLNVVGDLTEVHVTVSAGSLMFDGGSTGLDVDVSAGDANIDTQGPDTVQLHVSAGSITAVIGGEAPASTTVGVSAGDASLWLPDADYAVTGDVSAGDRTIDVRTDPASPHGLHVEVSAGSATVVYAD
jgi:hypothetical protein